MISSQLVCQLSQQNTAPVLQGDRFKSCTDLNFFQVFFFTTAKVVFVTSKIAFMFISLSVVHIYDFYIFTVIASLTKIVTSSQLASVNSVGRTLHWFFRGYRFRFCIYLNFFQALFSPLLKQYSLLRRSLFYQLSVL